MSGDMLTDNRQELSGGPDLGRRLRDLFDLVRRPDGSRYSTAEVARAVTKLTGEKPSRSYISSLRSGKRVNPTVQILIGMARFFGVPPKYFLDEDDESARSIVDQLRLARLLQDDATRGLAIKLVSSATDAQLPDVAAVLRTLTDRRVVRDAVQLLCLLEDDDVEAALPVLRSMARRQ